MKDKEKIKQLQRIIPGDVMVSDGYVLIFGSYLKDTMDYLYDLGICFKVEPNYIQFSTDDLVWVDSDIKRKPPLVDHRLPGLIKPPQDNNPYNYLLIAIFVLGLIIGAFWGILYAMS
ncbi:MAG: hypothetical protein NKF70_00200 [Methanobacterium sp. ERen5]|nr:MAG: hypothetical protein NKF70_00200 [Methanobacterium sp. ERen5]